MPSDKYAAGAVECELARIMICETADAQYIVLREKDGERAFPILIGTYEALAINRGVSGARTPRPLTHDLVLAVIEELSGSLKRIYINDLEDDTFYGRLIIEREGKLLDVDARPSDSIALAVLKQVPIFVAEKVLQRVASSGEPAPEEELPEPGPAGADGDQDEPQEDH